MNPNSSNICIRYSVWVIEEKYTHNLPIYLLYIIYNKIGANWCINPKRVKILFRLFQTAKILRKNIPHAIILHFQNMAAILDFGGHIEQNQLSD